MEEVLGSGKLTLLSGRLMRAARCLLGWTQAELAARSGVARGTILRLEAALAPDVQVQYDTAQRLQQCFKRAGVEFLEERSGSAQVIGLQLKLPASKSKRK